MALGLLFVEQPILPKQPWIPSLVDKFPCEQYLDTGESVLTPKVNLLGKAYVLAASLHGGADKYAVGEGEIGSRFRYPTMGR
jgi:hypothetical protein